MNTLNEIRIKLIDDFINELIKQENSSLVTNHYLDKNIANNLRLYLSEILKVRGKRILLVGEAPGYKGCKITGIPFTSGKVFEKLSHPLLQILSNQIKLRSVECENTATIVWEYLTEKSITPLFWNSFPFHPHPQDNEYKNRAPTPSEVELGIEHLKRIYSIYEPELVAGIGTNGVKCAEKAFPELDIAYIRHPSFGGKADFISGMDKIFL